MNPVIPLPRRAAAATDAEPVLARCFKCGGTIRPYLRSGIPIEQCEDCRGIFLDAGELERLIEAEGGGWSGRVGPPWPVPAAAPDGEPTAAGR